MASTGGAMPRPASYDEPVAPLLAAAADGDSAAWHQLVDRFSGLLWATARAHRLSTADAGDVVQTTWLRLVENLGRIHDPEHLGGWLATTARRECLAVLRRSQREPAAAVETTFAHVPDQRAALDAALITDERDATLWQLFEQLPDRCRTLLRVLLADPPPAYAEVADALEMPIGSIGPTRQRCLTQLRRLALDSGALDPGDLDLNDVATTTGGGAS
jgi:RNA polymerase sigma factor (sigma-70 family)